MGANGAYAFVLEVDMGWGVQGFFQAKGTYQGGWSVVAVNVPDFVGNFDVSVCHVEFLLTEFQRKDGAEVFGFEGLTGAGMQGCCRLVFHVGGNVIPVCGDFFFGEEKFLGFHVVVIMVQMVLVCCIPVAQSNKIYLKRGGVNNLFFGMFV